MKKLIKLIYPLLLSAQCIFTASAMADTAKMEGERIAAEMKKRDIGWNNSVSSATMVLDNGKGEQSKLELSLKSLELVGDGDKSLTVFSYPHDIKGTALLSFTHNLEADDKWLYLPALKRVKKISSRAKSGPFMGSEFAYEDMSSFELEKYAYRFLNKEVLNGVEMSVVEFTPRDKFSGYSMQKVWIDTTNYIRHKVEYYDRKKALLKTELATDYRLYMDKYWRAHKIETINHQTGKSTALITNAIEFNIGLSERDFNKATLRRARY